MLTPKHPDGYLALPPGGTGDPVLVLHAWWGLNEDIKALCERLAAAGFVAFAPDLYHGRVAATIPEAEDLVVRLDETEQQAQAEVAAAAEFLGRYDQQGRGLAVIAFSMGVYYSLQQANNAPDQVRRVIIFYGSGGEDFGAARAAYLGHFAADDPYEPPQQVAALAAALRDAGRPVTFHTYPGTGHWFFEPGVPEAYDADAAALAWERTLAFLRA